MLAITVNLWVLECGRRYALRARNAPLHEANVLRQGVQLNNQGGSIHFGDVHSYGRGG